MTTGHPRGQDPGALTAGTPVVVTDAQGEQHLGVAASDQVRGRDMVVVWVDLGTGRSLPWPHDAVRVATGREHTPREAPR